MDVNEAYAMLLTQEARIEQRSHMLTGMDVKNNFEANFAQNRGPKKGNIFNGKGFGGYGFNTGSGNSYNTGFGKMVITKEILVLILLELVLVLNSKVINQVIKEEDVEVTGITTLESTILIIPNHL